MRLKSSNQTNVCPFCWYSSSIDAKADTLPLLGPVRLNIVPKKYHSVCPLVRIGTPHPLSSKRVCPSLRSEGEGHTRLRGMGWGLGVPIQTIGENNA